MKITEIFNLIRRVLQFILKVSTFCFQIKINKKPCYLGIFAGLSSTKLNQTFNLTNQTQIYLLIFCL